MLHPHRIPSRKNVLLFTLYAHQVAHVSARTGRCYGCSVVAISGQHTCDLSIATPLNGKGTAKIVAMVFVVICFAMVFILYLRHGIVHRVGLSLLSKRGIELFKRGATEK